MKKLSYILSPIFVFVFVLLLVIFHPFQWLAFNLFGIKGHAKVVAALNLCLMRSMLLIGVTVKLKNEHKLPENSSLIFVSNKWGAAIFPEGTRSRTGEPKKFAANGLKIITKFNQDGYVVPLTINNSWKVFKYGKFPLGLGSPITITTHEPIKIDSMPFNELLEKTETIIKEHIK